MSIATLPRQTQRQPSDPQQSSRSRHAGRQADHQPAGRSKTERGVTPNESAEQAVSAQAPTGSQRLSAYRSLLRRVTAAIGYVLDSKRLRKAFIYFGFITGTFLSIIFGLDLLLGIPFQHASPLMDITFFLCGPTLGYLSWDAFKELV